MHWEAETFVWLALFRYLLYFGGLELNLQYLWCIPVYMHIFLKKKEKAEQVGRSGAIGGGRGWAGCSSQ